MQEFLSRYPYHSPVSRTDVCLSVCLSVSVGLCSCFFLVCLCSHFAVHFCGSVTAVNSRCDATLILTTSSELSPEREREREREREISSAAGSTWIDLWPPSVRISWSCLPLPWRRYAGGPMYRAYVITLPFWIIAWRRWEKMIVVKGGSLQGILWPLFTDNFYQWCNRATL